jgi:hypothetical protein
MPRGGDGAKRYRDICRSFEMAIIDFFKKPKRLKDLTVEDIRREEIHLNVKESQALGKLDKLDREKEEIFGRGAKMKSPVRRKQLARMYQQTLSEIQTTEHELARVGKEILTIGAIKLSFERKKEREKSLLGKLAMVNEEELQQLLEDDKISHELYMDKLGNLIGITDEASRDIVKDVGKEGAELLDIWQKMDDGEIDSLEDGKK